MRSFVGRVERWYVAFVYCTGVFSNIQLAALAASPLIKTRRMGYTTTMDAVRYATVFLRLIAAYQRGSVL